MLLDLTLEITPKMAADAQGNEKKALVGHLGTHFDVMDREFPLEYTERPGVVFDVSGVRDRDIDVCDIAADKLQRGIFAGFYTGFLEELGYGGKRYFTEHPQLSHELITLLLERGVSLIGVDCAGIRRGREHTEADQACADRGTFVIENLCNLRSLVGLESCTVHTYPVRYAGVTGLPCRVVASV